MASAGAAITMQTFLASSAKHDEPLNANRLRNHDKRMCDELEIKSLLPNGEHHHHRSMSNSLLHSPGGVGQAFGFSLGEPSPSTSAKPSHLIHRPSPINGATGVTSNGIIPELKSRVRHKTTVTMNSDDDGRGSSCSDRVADNEVSETLKSSESGAERIPRSKGILVPTKWQVLYFVAHTKALIIKRTGCELQVTDAASFPLFDIFQKSHCFRSTWILESYSRQVLVISDVSKTFATRRNEPQRFTVINAENETMGFFVTGDPFVIQNSERATVAHYNSFNTPESRLRNWHCVIDGTGQEICMLEHRKRDIYVVKFSGQLGFSLKLMVLAAAVQIAATPNMQTKSCCTLM